MKIVCSSDWHLDHVTAGVPRFEEIAAAVDQAVAHAITTKADMFIFAGDLCDPDSGVSVFRCVQKAFEAAIRLSDANIRSIWVAGNHDIIEDGSGDTTLSPLKAIGRDVHVADRPGVIWNVLALPFVSALAPYDPAAEAKRLIALHCPQVVVGHLNVPGIIPGEETHEMPRGREVIFPVKETAGIPLKLHGHYHRQQVTPEGIHIPGSLARLTFGEEAHTPGFLVFEV